MTDSIVIAELELRARVGVTAQERSESQRLTANLILEPKRDFMALCDDLGNTVDYAAVCEKVKNCAEARERNLIETLAGDIAEMVMADFELESVEVELRKFVLPGTRYVGVRIRRQKGVL